MGHHQGKFSYFCQRFLFDHFLIHPIKRIPALDQRVKHGIKIKRQRSGLGNFTRPDPHFHVAPSYLACGYCQLLNLFHYRT